MRVHDHLGRVNGAQWRPAGMIEKVEKIHVHLLATAQEVLPGKGRGFLALPAALAWAEPS
jgi:hypothetical protein